MKGLVRDTILRSPYKALLAGYWATAVPRLVQRMRANLKLGLKAYDFDSFERTSDTVFILGSGWSINELDSSRLEEIAQNDSFGFNFWLIHSLVPSLYFFEAIDVNALPMEGAHIIKRYFSALKSRDDYGDVPKIMTDFDENRMAYWDDFPNEYKDEVFGNTTYPIFARNESEVCYALEVLKGSGFFEQKRVLFKYRATVIMLATLAYTLGYKKIVLCGFDITDPRYFYHDEQAYPEWKGFLSSPPGKTHATGWEMPMMANVQEILSALDTVLFRPDGVELLVASESTALHPRFPVYRW
jgi:hypothetical protein